MLKQTKSRNIAPVKVSYAFIKIMTGSDLSMRRLPLMSAKSANPGPVVWLTACGHGDEVCGIIIVQEIFKNIKKRLLSGTIYGFPLMNPIGFETVSRNITVSREDLNRSFPGKSTGTVGERLASRIFRTIVDTSPNLVIDLHNDWLNSIPYALIDHNPGHSHKTTYDKTKTLARQSGFVSIVDTDKLTNTLSYNLLLNDIPALTFELCEPYLINEKNVKYGLDSITNILSHLGMIDQLKERFIYPAPVAYKSGMFLRYSDKPYSSKSGIIRFIAKPGEEIRKDQPLAKIVNAFGKHQETITAINDAIVLGHSDSSVVFPGMPVMAFGII